MSIKPDTLSQVPIFHLLGKKHLQEITKITNKKNYRKHEIIFHEGDLGNVLFVIKSGTVKISLNDAEGKETILTVPVSRQEMAAMTGISRKTLNHILNEFQVRGCLEVDGRKITIHDENILKREVL